MNTCSIQEVIVANNATRGTGANIGSPIRSVVQVFSSDGSLIATNDPCSFSIEHIVSVLQKSALIQLLEGESVHSVVEKFFTPGIDQGVGR